MKTLLNKDPREMSDEELDALAFEPLFVTGTEDQRQINTPIIQTLKKWEAERSAMSPAEIEQAEKEWERFKHILNENRMSYRMRYVD